MCRNLTVVKQTRGKDDERVLQWKFCLDWTGPFKVLHVGSSEADPEGKSIGDNLLHLDLSSELRRVHAKRRMFLMRCEPRVNLYDGDDRPRHLPAVFFWHVLSSILWKLPLR